MIKYAIFDLDGTLCDTLEAIRYYVNITIEEYGARPISREECRTFVGSGAKKLIERVMSSRGMSTELFDEIFEKYKSAYDANPYHLTKPYEGITEMLEALSSAGIGLAVLSNKQDGATQGAVKHFFGERFSAVFGGRDGVPLKPDKAAFDMVLDELSASADESQRVGIALPVFHFDGESYTKITEGKGRISLEYDGWICEYEAENITSLEIEYANRNGIYKGYIACGIGKTSVKVKIYSKN